jgi:hypothetical protein
LIVSCAEVEAAIAILGHVLADLTTGP